MPNVSHDLDPRYEGGIDAEVIGVETATVTENGYANISHEFGGHTAAWVPLEDGGQLRTTSYNQNRRERVQTFVQQEGGVNIGTEEWSGTRVAVLVLADTIE